MKRLPIKFLPFVAVMAGTMPFQAHAQSIDYGDVSQGSNVSGSDSSERGGSSSRRGRKPTARTKDIEPYIEVAQLVRIHSAPRDEVLTYSRRCSRG